MVSGFVIKNSTNIECANSQSLTRTLFKKSGIKLNMKLSKHQPTERSTSALTAKTTEAEGLESITEKKTSYFIY